MAEYSLTNKAVEDLTNIWNYTRDYWSEKQADKYYEGLIKVFEKITKNPSSVKSYDEINNSIFGYLHKKHIVFYTILNSNQIAIVRILHSSMDLKNRIAE